MAISDGGPAQSADNIVKAAVKIAAFSLYMQRIYNTALY
jgi:hypothetical protein